MRTYLLYEDIALYRIGNRASQESVPQRLVRAELQGRGLHEETKMTLLMQDTQSATKTVTALQGCVWLSCWSYPLSIIKQYHLRTKRK